MVKLFITQCVIGLFGNIIALAGVKAESNALTLATSIFSILFYVFLIYTSVWEIGSQDKPAIDGGREKLSPLTGLFISLGAHIPTFLFSVVYIALFPIATKAEGVASTVCGLSKVFLSFINGMYTGIMSVITIGGSPLHSYWFSYIIAAIPAILVTMLAYINGARDIHFTKLLLPVTPEEEELKREKKRQNNSNK